MEDGIQILIYLAVVAFSIISGIQKSRKKKATAKTIMPFPKEQTAPIPASVPKPVAEKAVREVTEKRKFRSLKEELQDSKTPLGRNPYMESIEYRKKRTPKVAKIFHENAEKENAKLNLSQVDWKEAIVYSEILKPRF